MPFSLLALPHGQASALECAYATPPRAYHDFDHVQEVLRHYDEIATGPGWHAPREVCLAVLYHDAVYEAGHGDNETRSAAMAREAIGRWIPDEGIDVERVVELIELTARHGTLIPEQFGAGPAADDTRHFLDCDMAILGALPETFDAYDRGIAEEYRGHVPGWLFRRKRRAFLQDLLARERIYLSDFFHARLEARARANIERRLASDD